MGRLKKEILLDDNLRRQPLYAPVMIIGESVSKPVMQSVGPSLPELDGIGYESVSPPVRRAWYWRTFVFILKFFVVIF